MRTLTLFAPLLLVASLAGCSTTQEVSLAKSTYSKKISTVAQARDEGNSPEMDAHLEEALRAEGMTVRTPPLPANTHQFEGVDAIFSYVDVWRWDLAMYLFSLKLRMFDGATGDLLATAEWKDSPMHGFRDAKQVVRTLVSEMLNRVRAVTTVEAPAAAREEIAKQ